MYPSFQGREAWKLQRKWGKYVAICLSIAWWVQVSYVKTFLGNTYLYSCYLSRLVSYVPIYKLRYTVTICVVWSCGKTTWITTITIRMSITFCGVPTVRGHIEWWPIIWCGITCQSDTTQYGIVKCVHVCFLECIRHIIIMVALINFLTPECVLMILRL